MKFQYVLFTATLLLCLTGLTLGQQISQAPTQAPEPSESNKQPQAQQKSSDFDFSMALQRLNSATTFQIDSGVQTPQHQDKICATLPPTVRSISGLTYRTSANPRLSIPLSNGQLCIDRTALPVSTASFILVSIGNCGGAPGTNPNGLCLPKALYVNPALSDINSSESSSGGTANPASTINAPNDKSGNNGPEVEAAWTAAIIWDDQGHIMPTQRWFSAYGNRYILLINGAQVTAEQAENDLPGFPKTPVNTPDYGLACQPPINIELFRRPDHCRKYQPDEVGVSIDLDYPHPQYCSSNSPLDNGITIAAPKIFDTFALRKMLAATANQLAGISAFNAAAITGAYGTLQGIQRDVSYIAAQLTTVPTPSITNTLTTPSNTTVTNTPSAGNTTTTVTTQCPPGYIPAIGSGNTVTCTAVPNGAPNSISLTTVNQPAGGSTVNATTGTPSTVVQTTTPSVTGAIPTAPASTALTAPTSTSVSASDMLAEQVQLSSQLTILQMLLQGASSDQLRVSTGRAIGMRGQTTLAFPITLRPPKAYKRAAAEVRVLLIPHRAANDSNAKLSIVNLLPSEKTYNVAKITSNQKAFGAGVAVESVNVGAAGGKSRDRLYIAKDTDTVALQYPTDKTDGIRSPWPSWFLPWLNNQVMGKDGSIDTENCTTMLPPEILTPDGQLNTDKYDFDAAVMFGWQFRPVLGADYVASGVRTVFAQLALPTDMSAAVAPDVDVYVQTRWRKYSLDSQVTGPSYQPTCQWKQIDDGITIYNPTKVKNVEVFDTGGGILRIRAKGDLLSSSLNVRSGSTIIPPQFFDGKQIEFFANAIDILHNGDLELLGEDGSETPLVIRSQDRYACSLASALVTAIPHPDGTATVEATMRRGNLYTPTPIDQGGDGPESYKILIGSDVYGLRETPFINDKGQQSCTITKDNVYDCRFTAQTNALRSAQTFLVRDIAWDSSGEQGTIDFAPSFTSISSVPPADLGSASGGDQSCGKKKGATVVPCWYEVKGNDFNKIREALKCESTPGQECKPQFFAYTDSASSSYHQIELKLGDPQSLRDANVIVLDNTTLRIADSSTDKLVTLHLVWQQGHRGSTIDWPLALKKPASTSITADPAVLYVSDSRAVKFSGQDFTGFVSATFDGTVAISKAATADKNPDANSVVLQIPASVTAKPGYKEIIAVVNVPAPKTNGMPDPKAAKSTPKTIALPVLVVAK